MIEVKCIRNENSENSLTIGKNYDVICVDEDGYYIILNDNNIHYCYFSSLFKPLSDIIKKRNDKIDKLLGE